MRRMKRCRVGTRRVGKSCRKSPTRRKAAKRRAPSHGTKACAKGPRGKRCRAKKLAKREENKRWWANLTAEREKNPFDAAAFIRDTPEVFWTENGKLKNNRNDARWAGYRSRR